MKKRKRIDKNMKFCPRCGSTLHIQDAYCLKCGYSFVERHKKRKTDWMRVILVLVVLAVAYIILRKFVLHKPILPDFSKLFRFNKTG